MKQNSRRKNDGGPLAEITGGAILKFLFPFIMTAFGILAAYHTTVFGLKLDLAQKADASAVSALDRKMAAVEIQLLERFMTKEDFYRMKEEISGRLAIIETKLERNAR